ncbi:unnamed protein product, partial [Timema podura]|nr:unnamed protein product [Timema podura]
MNERPMYVKTEPEEDFNYHLHQEVKLEMEGEINIPIKLEKPFEEDGQHNQPQESKSILPTFPPIKEECIVKSNRSGTDIAIKNHLLNQEIHKNKTYQSDHQLQIIAKCKREHSTEYDGLCFSAKHGGIKFKYTCKEGSCTKHAKGGGFCIKHGGTLTKCKEEGCSKHAKGGGLCVKHGGTQAKCKEEDCNKQAKGG